MTDKIITTTDRLILRMPTIADASDSFAIYSDSEVMKYVDGEEPFKSIDVAKENIKRGIAHYEKYGVCHWVMIDKESNEYIGHCGFNMFDNDDEIEIVAHLKKEFWGRGYATEAGEACLIYAKEKLPYKKAIGLIEPDNKASVRLIEKLGFAHTGELVEDGIKLLKYEYVL